MYLLSDAQIDYILNDIRARGVEMEDLQQNILDHVCCIIEQNLEENGDFEAFYQKTIASFYKDALWEIEEETLTLLIFKNYYTMKKILFTSGAVSTLLLTSGLLFKFMHWPGAGVQIMLGILCASCVFLPLMFTLKIKESQSKKDMLVAGIGTLVCILLSFHVLFKVMHWPLANLLGQLFLGVLALVFLPLYFFTGIRKPETKVNTIIISVLLVLGCGLILTLVRSPRAYIREQKSLTASYLRSEELLENETKLLAASGNKLFNNDSLSNEIQTLCEQLKSRIIAYDLGANVAPANFVSKNAYLSDTALHLIFSDDKAALAELETLKLKLNTYLAKHNRNHSLIEPLRLENLLSDITEEKSAVALQTLVQIQLYLLQNQRGVMAANRN